MRNTLILKSIFLSSALFLQMPVQADETKPAAAEPAKEKQGFLQKFDSNGDGKVGKDEFKSSMEKRFQLMDTDGNGTVSVEEFQQYREQQQGDKGKAKKIAKHDTDGDGSISKEEFLAPRIKRLEAKFAELDKNGDGKLSANEIPDGKKDKKQKQVKRPSLFPNIDANSDGQISDEEKNAAFERLFSRLDQNKDQIVTADEIAAGRKNRPAKQ